MDGIGRGLQRWVAVRITVRASAPWKAVRELSDSVLDSYQLGWARTSLREVGWLCGRLTSVFIVMIITKSGQKPDFITLLKCFITVLNDPFLLDSWSFFYIRCK